MPETAEIAYFREQLLNRRTRLVSVPALAGRADIQGLLREVDTALRRLQHGTFLDCGRCHESIEAERLIRDPLVRVCLGCLSEREQRALEHDLETAALVQGALLPPEQLRTPAWEIEHRYRPLGPVSGDYCDIIGSGSDADAPIHFILGDVSGKGVSASILMAHLQAVFRSLVSLDLPLGRLAERANSIFCEGTLANAFATLLLGRLSPDGTLEICNAGHCPPLLVRHGEVEPLAATGMPLGVFSGSKYDVLRFKLAAGHGLLLYTDGLTEATDGTGEAYGAERAESFAARVNGEPAGKVLQNCLDDLEAFRNGAPPEDDLSLMMIRRQI